MSIAETPPAFDEWCVVELLGRRRLAARVREQTIAGVGFLRLDEPDTTDGDGSTWIPGRTQYASPASVYALHPTTEEAARSLAGAWRTEPVQRWELPAALPSSPPDRSDPTPDREELPF